MQFNTTDEPAFRAVLHGVLQALPGVTDAGYTGYGIMSGGSFGAIFIQPNATEEIFNATFAPFYKLAAHPNVSAQIWSTAFPTWIEYCNAFLSDPNIATNIIDTSRLLTSDVLSNRTSELVDLVLDSGEFSAAFNFSTLSFVVHDKLNMVMLTCVVGKVNPAERDRTATHPIWKDSVALFVLGADWADDAPAEEKVRKKKHAVAISKLLGEIVGPDGGTYINEANP